METDSKLGQSVRIKGWGNPAAHRLTQEFIDEARERYAYLALAPMAAPPGFPTLSKWRKRISNAWDALRGYNDFD